MRAALALLLLVPAAAHAQTSDPYNQAVAARLAGDHARAVRLLEPLSREQPGNADVWLNLGLAYMGAGRLDEAEGALATALRLAPDYQDARDARARLARMRAAAVSPTPWRLDAVAGYSHLSDGLEPWRLAGLHVGRRLDGGALTVGVEHTDRFGRSDLYVEAVGVREFDGWNGYVALGGAPDADHRAEVAVRAGAHVQGAVNGGWAMQPGLDASWARYAGGDVKSLQPGLTLAGEALSLRARWIAIWDEFDEFRSGYGLDGQWRAGRGWLRAAWTDAAESSEGITVDVQAVSLGGGYDLDDRTGIRLDVTHEDRGAYDRDDISASLTRRF